RGSTTSWPSASSTRARRSCRPSASSASPTPRRAGRSSPRRGAGRRAAASPAARPTARTPSPPPSSAPASTPSPSAPTATTSSRSWRSSSGATGRGRGMRSAECGVRIGVLLLALAAGPAWAQVADPAGGEARLYVPSDSVSLGQRFAVAVAVEHGGAAAFFPEVPVGDAEAGPLLAFGDAEVFAARRLPPQIEGSVRVDSVVYEAATFALDRATVGPVAVRVVVGSDTLTVATGTRTVPVRSELFSMQSEVLPPGTPEAFPSPWPLYALLGLSALALVGLGV